MEVSSRPHALNGLISLHIGWEVRYAVEPVCMLWRWEKYPSRANQNEVSRTSFNANLKYIRTTFTDFRDVLADVNYSHMGQGEVRDLNALSRIYTQPLRPQ
jgi:hypothetical protein